MKIIHYTLLVMSLALGACQKDKDVIEDTPVPEVVPVVTMNRVVHYVDGKEPVQATYTENTRFALTANFDREKKRKITLGFDVSAAKGVYGDFVYFSVDTASLKDGFINTHSLHTINEANPGWSTTYGLLYQHADGGEELLHAVSDLGYEVEGQLTIQSYDPASQKISGSYNVLIKRLGFHPYKSYLVLNKDCTVSVAGSFKDLKVAVY